MSSLYPIIVLFLIGCTTAQIVRQTIRLNNGMECPILGLGNNEGDLDVAKQMVMDAIDVGYRHIDTAAYYGNEKAVGQAISDLIRKNKIRREELFVTSKIFMRTYPESRRRQQTIQHVQLALQKLSLDYIDLMLLHYPSDDPQVNAEIWSGLEEALDNRLVRAIGVSNFNVTQLTELMKTVTKVPQMNQIKSNPLIPNNEIIDYCKRFGIQVTAYSPLGKGRLTSHPAIMEIGKKHNKSAAQVMIRWQLQRGVVAIPKSTKKERIAENFNVFDFSLTEEDMSALNTIGAMNASSRKCIDILLILFTSILFLVKP